LKIPGQFTLVLQHTPENNILTKQMSTERNDLGQLKLYLEGNPDYSHSGVFFMKKN